MSDNRLLFDFVAFDTRTHYNQKILMKKAAVSLALTFVVSTFAGCSSADNSNSSNMSATANSNVESNKTNTNVEELGVLVNVPYESEEASWRQSSDKKKVIAVLRFSQAEANRLVEDAIKIGPAQPVTISQESWFPPELVAQGSMSGEDELTGKAYSANAFFQDPFNSGRITRIENTDYFVLELAAK